EVQLLTSQWMIRVKCHCRFGQIGNYEWDTALRRMHFNSHSDFRFNVAELKLIATDRLHQLFLALTIGLIGWNDNIFRLADLHSDQRGIETGDDLSGADGENQRFCPFRCVEHFTTIKRASVMHPYRVATFY